MNNCQYFLRATLYYENCPFNRWAYQEVEAYWGDGQAMKVRQSSEIVVDKVMLVVKCVKEC